LFLLSGSTTGLRKLILRTHNDYEYNSRGSGVVCGIGPDTVQIVPTEPDLATLRRIAVWYIGPERGNTYIDAFDPATQLTVRVVPGVLRTWDFADQAPLAAKTVERDESPVA
jgi:hypothetical protein